jgi:hypothetical protein
MKTKDCSLVRSTVYCKIITVQLNLLLYVFFSSTVFYSPYQTLTFLNGLLDPQTFGRAPWLVDRSNTRPLLTHGTTQHRNTQTHIHAPSRFRTCDLNAQAVIDSTCLRQLGCCDQLLLYVTAQKCTAFQPTH